MSIGLIRAEPGRAEAAQLWNDFLIAGVFGVFTIFSRLSVDTMLFFEQGA